MHPYNAMNSLSFPYPLVDFKVSKFCHSKLNMHRDHCLEVGSVTKNAQTIPSDHQSAFPSHPKIVTPLMPQWLISGSEKLKRFTQKQVI